MVRNARLLTSFENEQIRTERLTYAQSLKIFEALWKEAVSLGILPLRNPLEGIETDIELARILNSCSKNFIAKNPACDMKYIRKLLKEFEKSAENKKFLTTLNCIAKTLR